MPTIKLERSHKRSIVREKESDVSNRDLAARYRVSERQIRRILKIHRQDEYAYTVCLHCAAELKEDHGTHCTDKDCYAPWLKDRAHKYRLHLKSYMKTIEGQPQLVIPKDDLYFFIRVIAAMDSLVAKGELILDPAGKASRHPHESLDIEETVNDLVAE